MPIKPPFKKDLTPLTKGGDIVKTQGKGAREAVLPDRSAIPRRPANTMNNYAKATPTITQGYVSGGPIPCSRAHPCVGSIDEGDSE